MNARTDERFTIGAWVIGAATAVIAIVAGLVLSNWTIALQVAILGGVVAVAALDAWWMLLTLLLVRPLTDAFGGSPIASALGIDLNLSMALGMVAILWGCVVLFRRRDALAVMPLRVPLLAFWFVSVASVLWSIAPRDSVDEALRLTSIVVLYFVTMTIVRHGTRKQTAIAALAASFVVPSIVAVFQWATGRGLSFSDATNRPFGTFAHPNVLALALALMVVLLVAYWLSATAKRPRWMAYALGAYGFVLLLTQTRGAWLVCAIALLPLALLSYRRAVLWIATAALAFLLFGPSLRSVVYETWNVDLARTPVISRLVDAGSDEGSLVWRFDLWKQMSRSIAERPLHGHGLATFPVLQERQELRFFQGVGAHNDYLRLLAEIGIVGLGMYLWLFAWILVSLIKVYRRATDKRMRTFLLGVIGLCVGLFVESFFENVLQATPVMWMFWVALALTLTDTGKEKTPSSDPQGDRTRAS